MERQVFVIHKIRKTAIFALLDSSVTNMPSVEMLCQKQDCLPLYLIFVKI
jgi:hypothetical protein